MTKAVAKRLAVLLWYRTGLRVHDSPALVAACDGASAVYPVFCLDERTISEGRIGEIRLRFLAEALADLDASLRERGSQLIVLRGKPEQELTRVIKEWNASRLVYETDGVEPYGRERDANVRAAVEKIDVDVVETTGHTLCDLDDLLAETNGEPVTSYNTFKKHFDNVIKKSPINLAPTPDQVPPPLRLADPAQYALPTVEELAPSLAKAGPALFPGGEREALRRLSEHLERDDGYWAATFNKPKTVPTELEPFGDGTRATTVLSPYLRHGCLSPRTFWLRLQEALAGARSRTGPPVSLDGQLLWREFYYLCAKAVGPAFEQMDGNPIVRQIPWRRPGSDEAARSDLTAWKEGKTGYPWIDACMRQLATEGWIHHLARHAVACFLTRGDLYISWEDGVAVFDNELIDADWAVNNGNWMWVSCSAFFYQYFRCYSPVSFGKKYDKSGAYVKKYVPELARFPEKYIYEPWRASDAEQEKAGCRIGKDYPSPIVEHNVVSKENMGKMAAAYKQHKERKSRGGSKNAPTSSAKAKDTGKRGGAAASSSGRAEPEPKKRRQ